jgi:hypothetical protein
LVHLQNLPCRLFGKHDASHVHEHSQAHRVNELELFIFTRTLGLEELQKNRVPNHKRIVQVEFASVHAADPS